ncbi:hypothetical protein [Bacillus paranthracis]|uniref:hypothetical protein n=1 Tax=Bacillus paranthracis TaxID=2026186 RepID=UPI0018790C19|nr:hypothetical protein [Bacillus paranthracis]
MRNYLLTYKQDGHAKFEWFETVEEMQDFIDVTTIDRIFDALKIDGATDVEVVFNKNN